MFLFQRFGPSKRKKNTVIPEWRLLIHIVAGALN